MSGMCVCSISICVKKKKKKKVIATWSDAFNKVPRRFEFRGLAVGSKLPNDPKYECNARNTAKRTREILYIYIYIQEKKYIYKLYI